MPCQQICPGWKPAGNKFRNTWGRVSHAWRQCLKEKGHAQVLGEHDSTVKEMLGTFGVQLKPSAFRKDVKPLLKEACTRIFGTATGLVDMMVQQFPSSKAGSATKARPPSAAQHACLCLTHALCEVPHCKMWI